MPDAAISATPATGYKEEILVVEEPLEDVSLRLSTRSPDIGPNTAHQLLRNCHRVYFCQESAKKTARSGAVQPQVWQVSQCVAALGHTTESFNPIANRAVSWLPGPPGVYEPRSW